MAEKVTKTIVCDMCGEEIGTDDWTLRNSIISGGYYNMPVESHNEAYSEELMDGVEWVKLDLCPKCAKRATGIHMDALENGVDERTGRTEWKFVYSWKDGREA